MRAQIGIICFSIFLGMPAIGQAQSAPTLDTALQNVERAYSTDKLTAARTIRIEEDRREAFFSHDYGPEFHDLTSQRRHYIVDLKAERSTSEYVTVIGTNNYHGRSILSDGRTLFIDYGANTYEPQGSASFDDEHNRAVRGSDVLLALTLANNKEAAKLKGQEMWLGRWHSLIEFSMEGSPPLVIYVENETGLITKMTRAISPEMTVHYTYKNHKEDNGYVLASEFSVYANRDPLYFSFNRGIHVNDRKDRKAFEVDKGIVEEPARVDQSEMTVEALSDKAYHVGQAEAYSTFIRSNDGLIVYGTQAGLADRIEAYRKETGDLQTLRFAVVSDHHSEDLEGVRDATVLGATLVLTPDTKPVIAEMFEGTEKLTEFVTVDPVEKIGGVQIITLPTAHASQILTLFEPETGLLAQSGHYISPYVSEGFYAKHTAVSLMEGITDLILEPKFILSTASRKAEHWADFENAVSDYDATRCFRKRPICDEKR